MDEEDDLFAGLGEPKTKPKPNTANSNDFMSSLFGGSNSSRRGSATKEFVLEDKYIAKPENTIRGPGRRGSGTPFLNSDVTNSGSRDPPKIVEPVISQPSNPQLEFTEAPSVTLRTPNSNTVNDNLQKQMNQMEDFEREQNSLFGRTI